MRTLSSTGIYFEQAPNFYMASACQEAKQS
jgi:hypothetical protein